MRTNVPASVIARWKSKSPSSLAVTLDVMLADNQVYYWTDWAGIYTVKIGNQGTDVYLPYLMSGGEYRQSRSFQTDAGDIVLQNLSGNTIDRDVAKLLIAHEFEGAFVVMRVWDLEMMEVVDEFHGVLTDQQGTDEQVSFRITQLLDSNQYSICIENYQETCSNRFKSERCGSVSANAFCTKILGAGANDCTAVQRFTGCPNPPPVVEATGGSTWRKIGYDVEDPGAGSMFRTEG